MVQRQDPIRVPGECWPLCPSTDGDRNVEGVIAQHRVLLEGQGQCPSSIWLPTRLLETQHPTAEAGDTSAEPQNLQEVGTRTVAGA